jgi:hypothetical protein
MNFGPQEAALFFPAVEAEAEPQENGLHRETIGSHAQIVVDAESKGAVREEGKLVAQPRQPPRRGAKELLGPGQGPAGYAEAGAQRESSTDETGTHDVRVEAPALVDAEMERAADFCGEGESIGDPTAQRVTSPNDRDETTRNDHRARCDVEAEKKARARQNRLPCGSRIVHARLFGGSHGHEDESKGKGEKLHDGPRTPARAPPLHEPA